MQDRPSTKIRAAIQQALQMGDPTLQATRVVVSPCLYRSLLYEYRTDGLHQKVTLPDHELKLVLDGADVFGGRSTESGKPYVDVYQEVCTRVTEDWLE